MTRPQFLSRPTVKQSPIITVKEFGRRHVTILCSADIYHKTNIVAGGYELTGGVFLGGGGTIFGDLNGNAPGGYYEWKLGVLQCDRPWEFIGVYKTGPNRGILRPSVDGVDLTGAVDTDCYATNYVQKFASGFVWTPTPDDLWKDHTLRITCVGKNAAASNFGLSLATLTFDRSIGSPTITPSQP